MCLEIFFLEIVFDSPIQILGFTVQNSLPVEVVLTENTTDWNNRLRFQMANANATEINVLLINLPVHWTKIQ
jgi:uncharacterized protein YciU (UPF0263 family)